MPIIGWHWSAKPMLLLCYICIFINHGTNIYHNFVATPAFLPALANLYGDKSTMMLLSGGGGKKAKKIGGTSTSKVDLTCGGGKVSVFY